MEAAAWPSVLERIRQGDQAALALLLAWLHQDDGKKLRNQLRNRGVPAQIQEDVVADAQTKVLAELAAGKFRGHSYGEFVVYVSRICSTCIRRYRRWTREIPASAVPAPTNPMGTDLETPFEFPDDNTATDPAMAASLHTDLAAALAWVRDRHRQAWILYRVRCYSFSQIACLMNCAPARARKLVSDAEQALRVLMTFLGLVVDIHLMPSPPEEGQQIESWLTLWNNGYADVQGLWVTLQVDRHRLGSQSTEVFLHHHTTVRGFTLWTRRQGRQTLRATRALGRKKSAAKHSR
jgi:DNA-directed RNA polymerase specialized sigma24 family protein